MRILALLSFYDERPQDLIRYVASLRQATVDHLVAVDGAYALFPDARPVSPPEQRGALMAACVEAGIGLTLHTQPATWAGNEPHKRGFLFGLAHETSEPGDWFWVLDTDELVREVPPDFRDRLEDTEHDVAEVTLCDVEALQANKPNWPARFTQRRLFRAQPIRLRSSHFEYFRADGSLLGLDPQEGAPCLDCTDVTVWHAHVSRDPARSDARHRYYIARDTQGVELGSCACGALATEKPETNWRWSPEMGPVADIAECCASCARQARWRNRRDLGRMGVDPESVRVAHRYGRPTGVA